MNMCRFEEKEIPPFSLPVRLASGNEQLEMDILEEIVQQNYVKIIEDVNRAGAHRPEEGRERQTEETQ